MKPRFLSSFVLFVVVAVVGLLTFGVAIAQDELTVSYMESGTYDVAANELAANFTPASVNVVAFPWAILRQNNTNDLISGAGEYDVMSGGYYLADVYSYFSPLTEFIERDSYAEGMIPGLMDPGASEWSNGEQIGIPYGIDSYGLLVNNEILEQAGVEPVFNTWADFIAACEKIAAAMPDIACFSHATGNPEQIGAFFFSGYDGTFVNADGVYELDVEKAVPVIETIVELWKYLPPQGNALTFDEAHQVFMDGNAAMLVTWPSFVSNALDAETSGVAGKWSQVAFPGPGFPWLSLWQQFIPATTENKDAAWEWIKTFAGEENAKSNYVNHNINSVWLSTYEDEELAAAHAHQWPAMLEDFARAKNPPLSGESQDFLTNTLVQAATGQITPQEAADQVNAAWASMSVPPALLETASLAGFQAE